MIRTVGTLYPVLQPDGHMAIYNPVDRSITQTDLTDLQAAVATYQYYSYRPADGSLTTIVANTRAGIRLDGQPNWTEAVAHHLAHRITHNPLDDDGVRLISMTPSDQRQAIAYRINVAASRMIKAIDEDADAILLALENTKAGE